MQDCQCGKDEDGENIEHLCPIYCKLSRFDWYWGNISRIEVEYLLLKYPGNFIIRASSDINHILCISFRVDPQSCLKGPASFSHMTLKHYKGLFSLDRKDYVPIEGIPKHCKEVGRQMQIFNGTVLEKNEDTVLEMSKIFCKQRVKSK